MIRAIEKNKVYVCFAISYRRVRGKALCEQISEENFRLQKPIRTQKI